MCGGTSLFRRSSTLGITVVNRFDGDYESVTTKAVATVAAGRPPAMMVTSWKFGYFAKRTLEARDLREIDATKAEAAILANFRPSVLPLVTIDGAVIGLPWAMSTPITYINSEMWKAVGLDPKLPETPDTKWLYDSARKLDAALKDKHPTYRSPIALSNNEWTSQSFIQECRRLHYRPRRKVGPEQPRGHRRHEGILCPGARWSVAARQRQGTDHRIPIRRACHMHDKFGICHHLSLQCGQSSHDEFPRNPRSFVQNEQRRQFLCRLYEEQGTGRGSLAILEFCASKEEQMIWSEVGYLNTSVHDIPHDQRVHETGPCPVGGWADVGDDLARQARPRRSERLAQMGFVHAVGGNHESPTA